jgi:hypothetical protein
MKEKADGTDLVAMYKHVPATEIKVVTGLKFHQIYKRLREAGVSILPRGRRPRLQNPGKEALEALRIAGYSQREIGQLCGGVSKRTVQRWLKK